MKNGFLKKLPAFLLVLILSAGLICPAAYASDIQSDTPLEKAESDRSLGGDGAGWLSVEKTDSFSSLLANTLEASSGEEQDVFAGITDLVIEGASAVVTLWTSCDANLHVYLYDDETSQKCAEGHAFVSQEKNSVTVPLNTANLPDFFVAEAALTSAETGETLCEPFTCSLYTKQFQSFLALTVNDFNPEQVLNLDQDPATNFLVFKDGTVLLHTSSEYNHVTDYQNGTILVADPDAKALALQPGDSFAALSEDSTVAGVVASVEKDGSDLLITTEAGADLADLFEIVKIDMDMKDGETTIDTSDMAEGVTLEESSQANGSGHLLQALPPGEETQNTYGFSDRFSINTHVGEVYVSGGLLYSFTFTFRVFIGDSFQYTSLKLDYSAGMDIVFEGGVAARLNLGKFITILPGGFTVTYHNCMIMEASGAFSVSGTLSGTVGMAYDSRTGRFVDLSKRPVFDSGYEAKVSVFLGFQHETSLKYLLGLVDVTQQMRLGVQADISQEQMLWGETTEFDEFGSIHDCDDCYKGEYYTKIGYIVSISLLYGLLSKEMKWDMKFKLGDFYWSVTFNEWDFGYCPHRSYKVTVAVMDGDGNGLIGYKVTAEGTKDSGVTDADGTAILALPNGEYRILALLGEEQKASADVVIDREPRDITLVIGGENEDSVTGEQDGVYYTKSAGGLCVFYGTGALTKAIVQKAKNEKLANGQRPRIRKAVIREGITSIGEAAFWILGEDRRDLLEVTIPDSVTYIGPYAFQLCESLTELIIPENVTRIGHNAFSSCNGLKEFFVPNGEIDMTEAFLYGSASMSVHVTIGGEKVGVNCLLHSDHITEITVLDGVKVIERGAFADCYDLVKIDLPESVTYIGDGAFTGCYFLESISLPEGITAIRGNVFERCEALTQIKIPENVTVIGNGAFEGCSGLQSLVIPERVTSIGNYAFSGCTSLRSFVIPDSVTSLGTHAFSKCTSLSELTIGKNLTWFPDYCCVGCDSLREVVFPENITGIGYWVFHECSGLEKVWIAGCANRVMEAFIECGALRSVYYGGTKEQWKAACVTWLTKVDYFDPVTVYYGRTNDLDNADVSGVKDRTYTGKKITQAFGVAMYGTTLKEGKDYLVSYRDNLNAGTAKIVISGTGIYKGTKTVTFTINPVKNTITKVTASKTLKYNKLKKRAQTFQIAATVKGNAKKTFRLVSVPKKARKYITVSKAGKVTLKKGLAKGTYKLKVSITAAKTKNYKQATVTKTVKIVVK